MALIRPRYTQTDPSRPGQFPCQPTPMDGLDEGLRDARLPFSSLTTLVFLAANTASAGFVVGDYFFELRNDGNGGGGASSGPSFTLPTGPTATSDGAIWVRTGSTYALNEQDVNIECDFRTAPDQPTTVISNTILLSTHVADWDTNYAGYYYYPGYFLPGEFENLTPYQLKILLHITSSWDSIGCRPWGPRRTSSSTVFLVRQRDQLRRRRRRRGGRC